ncbi:hypothetical protein ACGTJS_03435 [Faucicola mancuniensis]|uniref:hypothetical protein n=1 Tax=Faucicola mancuniensis TaxID=1309795 RepID=UPI0028EAF472|nr:hypothetical protein [uncultured Moraxella sp.]
MDLEQQLFERYVTIVKENQDFLDNSLKKANLPKLFLTSVPKGYENAQHKIMIVGRETKNWLTGLKDFQYDEQGIQLLMDKSSKIQADLSLVY